MFQLSRSSEPNPTNLNPNTALPNNYGHIRTLKGDLENLRNGKKELDEKIELPPQPASSSPSREASLEKPKAPVSQFHQESSPSSHPPNPFSESGRDTAKKDVPNPFGSETFFDTKSPFEEKSETPKNESSGVIPKPKSSGKFVIILSALLILSILGGGVYYWWFFMRTSSENTAQTSQAPTDKNGQTTPVAEENTNLKKWSLDLQADKIASKLAIERNIKSLAGSASLGKVTEIKLISSDGQPVTSQKFEKIFDFQLPASISEKLTDDYSLFLTSENSESRLGAAFKLSQSENLSESLKSEEKNIVSNLKSFYLDKTLGEPEILFSSSKYKSADIRYFNFPSPTNTSFDYTVLSDKQNTYFIFSTSKDSIRAILDYMSEK